MTIFVQRSGFKDMAGMKSDPRSLMMLRRIDFT